MQPLIELRGITKTYGSGSAAFQALRGIDLDIEAGEFVAVMGPSGSGKSTVMNLIGCLDTPSAGSYRFQGVAVQDLSRDQRALLRRHHLGFVFQGFHLLARTTALERVAIARAIVTEPTLLLADEPTGNLDSARGHEIMVLLATLQRERGITVLMVTHEPEMAAYARRVLRFKDGLIAGDERQVAVAATEAPA